MTDDLAGNRETDAVAHLRAALPIGPPGQTWVGDDAAVVDDGLLLAVDSVVAGVHLYAGAPVREVGYRAVVRNVSDMAAMGARPLHLLVAVVGAVDVVELYHGILEATSEYDCAVVGGDISAGPALVVTVAVTGRCISGSPVLRSGARAGDEVWVAGELGAAAASEYRLRPVARVAEGEAAREAGATAMIDVSDGLYLDARRLAQASGLGLVIDEERVPVAPGATLAQAVGGGDDYALLYTLPAGRSGPGVRIGRCTADPTDLPPALGWVHDLR